MDLPLENLTLSSDEPGSGESSKLTEQTGEQTHPQNQKKENPFGLKTQRDMAHWSYFGRRGIIQCTRAVRRSWTEISAFRTPCTVSWSLPLSSGQLSRLLHGFYPIEMEDKWFIYADGPYADGSARINFHRSWTGHKVAQLVLKIYWGDDDARDLWEGRIVQLLFEGEKPSTGETEKGSTEVGAEEEEPKDTGSDEGATDTLEEMAMFQVLEACNWVLGIKLVEKIEEPKSWARLAQLLVPVTERGEPTKTYRGTNISKETLEDLQRFGTSGVPLMIT